MLAVHKMFHGKQHKMVSWHIIRLCISCLSVWSARGTGWVKRKAHTQQAKLWHQSLQRKGTEENVLYQGATNQSTVWSSALLIFCAQKCKLVGKFKYKLVGKLMYVVHTIKKSIGKSMRSHISFATNKKSAVGHFTGLSMLNVFRMGHAMMLARLH